MTGPNEVPVDATAVNLDDVESPWTERRVLDLLAARYTVDLGNGPRYVFAEHVRSAAGFDARRTADAMAVCLWPSDGNRIHGFEVKVSRSDWLRELRDPSKAAEFMGMVDYWWLVAPAGVASVDELPPGWGMILASPGVFSRLRVVVQAPLLDPGAPGPARPVPRGLLAVFARAAVRTAARVPEREVQAALV